MILVDFHQTIIANTMRAMYSDNFIELNENTLRGNILSSLLKYRRMFKAEYGDLIICTDSKRSWRKDAFPYYKAKRKEEKEESLIDWDFIHKTIEEVKTEIKKYLPYPLIQVEKAEADDIIGVLNSYLLSDFIGSKNVIVSLDKDMMQLLSSDTIIYNPIKKIIHDDTNLDVHDLLLRHIINGDTADGIPNILSDDDTFVMKGKRQKPITQNRMENFLDNPDTLNNTHFNRNQYLIDYNFIPINIRDSIIEEYEKVKNEKKSYDSNLLIEYFMEKRLNNMLENIQNFYI